MAKRARKGEFWLVRVFSHSFQGKLNDYSLYPAHETPVRRSDGTWADKSAAGPFLECMHEDWEASTPKSLHLPPGGGPIRIRVELVK